jgi:uncharacterized 2Fe-2S/4Fe-4S cluster protein (DUF4445 family)
MRFPFLSSVNRIASEDKEAPHSVQVDLHRAIFSVTNKQAKESDVCNTSISFVIISSLLVVLLTWVSNKVEKHGSRKMVCLWLVSL